MPSAPRQDLSGRLLDGRYEIVEHLADGGMASVWRGVDRRLDREVAIKILGRHLGGDPAFADRFRREARSAARLNDPRVVAVFDQGEDDGDLFLVMELVPGRTLRQVIHDEAPLTPRAALDLALPVAEALSVAHDAGLMHRDIKPENVIIRPDGQVKVADFGLARAVTSDTATALGGNLIGTVSYLAPEQVERGASDARSDVYATGLLLYEMLTGRKAYEGDNPIHVAYQHVHGTVPAPSETVPGTPKALDEVVAWATARDPQDRPADGGALAARLRRVRASLPVEDLDARPVPLDVAPTTPTIAMPRRKPGDTAPDLPTGAAVGAAVGAGSTRTTNSPGRPRRRTALWLVPLLALLLGGWYFLAGPGATTQVPAVKSLSQSDAEQALTGAHLTSSVEEGYSETVPKGAVIDSTPQGGSTAHRGDTVQLIVSKGPERYAVPQVAGQDQDAATAAITAAHLSVGTIRQDWSETVASGKVIATDPPVGSEQKPLTKVTVIVSKGKQPIDVPSLTGKTLADATTIVTDLKLTLAQAPEQVNHPTIPAGSIVSQTPSKGQVHAGDTITVTVSKGPKMVAVPNLFGKQRDEAVAMLRSAGLGVSVEELFGGVFGTVRSQDPSAGTQVPEGTTVTIRVV
ncbi:Stk1 family PASTA domain-containing Ser/Thr kinase [Arsenicicoccus piscis]|uniref:Stk1 family PASTA domain-containing Ser/Thr kinase n=1 Tax=Arsenicicoccus piscis TaxID=673954 RepID=UPI001F4CA850|nr:Stk1 family PASTA domain-containing Ser/Thr kinase [Arsenicicoccus piscis]